MIGRWLHDSSRVGIPGAYGHGAEDPTKGADEWGEGLARRVEGAAGKAGLGHL